jgi:hypothetical protein
MRTLLLTVMGLIPLLTGCFECDKSGCVRPPHPFQFRIIDRHTGEDLVFGKNPVYHEDSIRLFYYEDGAWTDLVLRTDSRDVEISYFTNQTLPYISAASYIKDYYLRLSYEDTDTLLLDVRMIDFECCTVFEWRESYYNGRKLRTSTEDYTVFLLEK